MSGYRKIDGIVPQVSLACHSPRDEVADTGDRYF